MKNLVITLTTKNAQDVFSLAQQVRPVNGVSHVITTCPKKIQAVIARPECNQVVIKLTDPSQKQAEQMLLELLTAYKLPFLSKAVLSGPKSKNDPTTIPLKEWPKDF